MFAIFFLFANQREKWGKIFISGVKMCPQKAGSANFLSTLQRVNYERLTSDSTGKVNLSVDQRCPLIRVLANQRFHCISSRAALFQVGYSEQGRATLSRIFRVVQRYFEQVIPGSLILSRLLSVRQSYCEQVIPTMAVLFREGQSGQGNTFPIRLF